MEVYLEKVMEQLNSGEYKRIFSNMSCIVIMVWRQVEENHGKRRRKQEKIPVLYWFVRSNLVPPSSSRSFRTQSHLRLLYRTMLLFRVTFSDLFIMSDVQSIYIPLLTRDWYLEIKFWAIDRKYSFCLWIPWTKTIRILVRSTWVFRVMHNTFIKPERKHQNTVYWVDINLALKKGFEVLSITIWRYHSSRNTPSLLFSESCSNENLGSLLRKSICVTSFSSKDLLETWLDERIGFRSCSATRGPSATFFWSSQSNQPNPNPGHDDRTVTPAVCRDASHAQGHEQSMLNEVNIDIRIPGLPHSVVKTSFELSCSWIGQEDREPPSPTISSARSKKKKKHTTRSIRRQRKWFRTSAT